MGARRYEDLEAWQLCRELTDRIALVLKRRAASDDYDLFNQLRNTSRSACRNLAEGFGRFFPREFAPFARIARGSLAELGEHLRDANAAGWLVDDEFDSLMRLRDRAMGAATNLHRYLIRCSNRRDEFGTGTTRPDRGVMRERKSREP